MGIDFQGLLAVVEATENNPHVNMQSWKCGTAACAIGSFCVANPTDALRLESMNNNQYVPVLANFYGRVDYGVAERFGITSCEARFLFMGSHSQGQRIPDALELTKSQALARLRKFIYYKLHKQEMVVENNDRNRSIELPRNVSGRRSVVMAQSA